MFVWILYKKKNLKTQEIQKAASSVSLIWFIDLRNSNINNLIWY